MELQNYHIDDINAVLGCMRKDKKANVHFMPIYKQYYVRSEEWSGWQLFGTWSRGRLPLNNSKGTWYTNILVSYTDIDGKFRQFNFTTLRPNYQIFQNEAYDYIFPRFSLRAGKYKFTVTSQIYEDLMEYLKKPVKEEFTDTLEVIVPEEGPVLLYLCAGVSVEYDKFQKFDTIFWKWETKRKVVSKNFEHWFLQLTPEEAEKLYKFWRVNTDKVEVIPEGEPWGFEKVATKPAAKTTTKKSSSSAKTVKSDYDEKINAVKGSSTTSKLLISDTYGNKGVFSGAQVLAEPYGNYEYITLRESQTLGIDKKMKAEIYTDGDIFFYQENKYGIVGGAIRTNNNGGIYYTYTDSNGLKQRYTISINPNNINVYEIKDGYLTGKAYSVTANDVYESRTNGTKIMSEDRLISTPLYAKFPSCKIDIPRALTGKTLYLTQDPNNYSYAQFYGGNVNGYGLYSTNILYAGSLNNNGPHGVGICRNGKGVACMGGFNNKKMQGLTFMINNDVEYICSYNNGNAEGMFLELRDDRVIFTKYDYPGKVADRSIVIYSGKNGFGFYNSIDRYGALNNIPRVYHKGGGVATKHK